MTPEQETIRLLQKHVRDLQEVVLQLAENQQTIVGAGILTNNAIMRLTKRVEQLSGADVDGDLLPVRTLQ